MRDGLVELENASSGWRRRLLQSQRGGDGSGSGGRSQRDGDDTSRGGMPGMPAPVTVAATTTAPPAAAASQYTQVPYAIAEEDEHQQRHLHGHHSQPPAAQPSPRSRSRRRFGRGFFYAALIIATILILARTAFRVVEFSQPSWRRSTATTSTIGNPNDSSSGGAGAGTVEILLALFDGSFVALAAALLLAAHPLLTLVSDPSLVLAAQTREERAHAWYYGPGAGGAERHRRVQDWVETITLGGGGSTTTGAGGGGARSMSRRFSWVSSSRWTGRSGGGEQQQQQEVGANGVVEPERAVIPMYR
ncbi:hypothetical protein Micbo1qcDRAFT_161875 [Microdochium bolleyi]|uniref:Uncharacterized protein n=1 Tax=Microdochium bolleyi TaxID=196109 RepID=A0A136J4G0_9PEZI|nr:hypothetical protein Micbo1qcDRAFT_161875 [Microdochium bolleyi]